MRRGGGVQNNMHPLIWVWVGNTYSKDPKTHKNNGPLYKQTERGTANALQIHPRKTLSVFYFYQNISVVLFYTRMYKMVDYSSRTNLISDFNEDMRWFD